MDFNSFGFKKFINEALKNLDFQTPTPVQRAVIPLLKKHQNVVALSHPGTGKTHAFLLPLINNLADDHANQVQLLIITPTRELAQQTFNHLDVLTAKTPFKSQLLIGGTDLKRNLESLAKEQPTIVVGTPSRLKELYLEKALQLTTADALVVDEVDMLFEFGFWEDLIFLFSKFKPKLQTAFFSATINAQLGHWLKKSRPQTIFIDQTQEKLEKKPIQHYLLETKEQDFAKVLPLLIKKINPYLALIFVNQKTAVSEVVKLLRDLGLKDVGELHSDLTPRTRVQILKKIKNHEFTYVVVTDVAARGLDFPGVTHIISLNLPKNLNYYTHRAGRAGRQGQGGESYIFKTVANEAAIRRLQAQGINFTLLTCEGTELKILLPKSAAKKGSLDPESQKVIRKYQNQKVKPSYKKKRQLELEKIKKQRRRKNIQQSIAKIKKEKYKQRRSRLFNE